MASYTGQHKDIEDNLKSQPPDIIKQPDSNPALTGVDASP
jgi:hypothetical protein